MKNKKNVLFSLIIILSGVVNFPVQGQQKKSTQKAFETKNTPTSQVPNSIVRTIKQDKKGNIWIASWEGVFKYNGKSFTNITSKVSSTRFFSVLEDRKGKFWFASIGSGVYYYDGKSFKNFTTKDGLANNVVTTIYEDKTGVIWFGTENGVSYYDGKSFRNLKIKEIASNTQTDSVYVGSNSVPAVADSVSVLAHQNPLPKEQMHNDINAIIEDKTGNFWFATRGYAAIYNGKTFTTITNKEGKSFANIRSMIKDKKGNIWLGGYDGLWRFDGSRFTKFSEKFVGYIYEDRKGNIWTSSESDNAQNWILSCYDEKSLNNKKPIVAEIANKPMIFGILEDDKGGIWFGSFDGVYRYNGKNIINFKNTISQQ